MFAKIISLVSKWKGEAIRLHIICPQNSRSHLSQILAQTMAYYIGIWTVFCYSGGTETTSVFPKISETLSSQGFQILRQWENGNPIYAVKFSENENPIVCFSKIYNHLYNPSTLFAAILTCNHADEECPVKVGAEVRFPIKYDDPKAFDGTHLAAEKYAEKRVDIAREMWWVLSQIK